MTNRKQNSLFAEESLPVFNSLTGTIVGVDEVGRGPLVGDVVAAAVILPSECQLPLKDSKKLSEVKREALAVLIKEQAVAYAFGIATPEEIDMLNILQATLLAMKRAIDQLINEGEKITQVYVDGNRCPKVSIPCQSVVKGDDRIMEISAASILAKVYRDQQMLDLHQKYPQYGFDQHKGYPTPKHLQAIQQYGIFEGYRHSFKPVRNILN